MLKNSWFSPRMVFLQKKQEAYMDVSGRAMQEQLPSNFLSPYW